MAKNYYDYEEKDTPKKVFTVVEIIVIAILALAIIAMLLTFFLFSKEGSAPKIFGYNIFLSTTQTIDDIPSGAAVFAKEDVVQPGRAVLCQIGDQKLTALLRVQEAIIENEKEYYILSKDSDTANAIKLPAEDIIAVAKTSDVTFGKFLSFATSRTGFLVAVIVPCLLIIAFQVIRIVRINKMEEYEDDDEYDDDDDDEEDDDEVRFSTLKQTEQAPQNRVYVDEEGRADFSKKPAPTANYEDFQRTRRPQNPMNDIHSQAAENLSRQRSTVTENFTQKASVQNRAAEPRRVYQEPKQDYLEPKEKYYEKPAEKYSINEVNTYSRQYYKKEDRRLDPPAVENPVDITIPAEAVTPRETIAPPPKQTSNKTLEDLMRVIDNNLKK